MHLSRQQLCSLAFDLDEGFSSSSIGRTTAAFIAMDSIAELEAKALYNLASSDINDLPTLTKGVLKIFGLQCRISL